MCFSSCACFPKEEAEHPSPGTPWCLLLCSVHHFWRAAVPTDGERCPSVLSWACSSRLYSSGRLAFVPNYKEQLHKVTQALVYPEEIMCSFWPDGIVANSIGFWMLKFGVTESGFCCTMQFYVSRQSVENVSLVCHTFNTTHDDCQESFSSYIPVHDIYLSMARNMRRIYFCFALFKTPWVWVWWWADHGSYSSPSL